MLRIFVKPADGLSPRDELDRPYPADGREVNKTVYVTRLLNEGALVVTKKPRATKKHTEESEA